MANKFLTAQEISPNNSPMGSMNTYYENNLLSDSSFIIHNDASLVKCNTFVMTEDESPITTNTSFGNESPVSFENSPNGLHSHYDKFGTYGVPTNSPMDSPMNSPKRLRNIHRRLFKNKRSFSMDDVTVVTDTI